MKIEYYLSALVAMDYERTIATFFSLSYKEI